MSPKLQGNLLCRFSEVFQVCSLQDKIYVLSKRTMIRIYEDKAPYGLLESRNIPRPPRVLHQLELVACPVHKCLYIADLPGKCVWKMNPADDHQPTRWLPEPVSKLSVSSEGKVLVLDDGDPTRPKLRIYTHEAKLEMDIPMPGGSNTLLHYSAAVELMPRVVAVPCGKFGDSTNILTGIVIMRLNETGDILHNVETTRFSSLASYSPGRLIAADQESKQVIVLDSQLKPLQVLLSPDTSQSQWPRLLCYRSDTRELIVNHFDLPTNQFNVYKLSYDDESE